MKISFDFWVGHMKFRSSPTDHLGQRSTPVALEQLFITLDCKFACSKYCKFGNFRVTFISQIFYFRFISKFLNSQVSVHVFYKVDSDFISETFARQPIHEY